MSYKCVGVVLFWWRESPVRRPPPVLEGAARFEVVTYVGNRRGGRGGARGGRMNTTALFVRCGIILYERTDAVVDMFDY